MTQSTLNYSSEFKLYQERLTRVLFSYRHLLENLILDKDLVDKFFTALVLSSKDSHNFIRKVDRDSYEDIAHDFVDLLLTNMRARGECFRENTPKRYVEQALSRPDPYVKFMEVCFQFLGSIILLFFS